jgi:hypothetical protein
VDPSAAQAQIGLAAFVWLSAEQFPEIWTLSVPLPIVIDSVVELKPAGKSYFDRTGSTEGYWN